MAATPTSTLTAYGITGTVLLKYFDSNVIGDLINDDGVRVDPAGIVDDPVIVALLSAAAGQLEAACLCGRRYDVDDIAALTGGSMDFRNQIICYLAVGGAIRRRQPTNPLPAVLEWAEAHLKMLRMGEEIFGLVETQQAGVEEMITRQPGDSTTLPGRVVERASRYFGRSGGFDHGYRCRC